MKITPLESEPPAAPHPGALGEDAKLIAMALKRPSVSGTSLGIAARLIDIFAIGLALWFADFAAHAGEFSALRTAGLATVGAVVTSLLLAQFGGYEPFRLRNFVAGAATLFLAGLVVAVLGAIGGVWAGAAGAFLSAALVSLVATILPARALVSSIARLVFDFGLTERRAVVAGGGENAARLVRGLIANPANDIRICGIFDDRDDGRSPPVVGGVPKLGRMADLVEFARTAEIDMLIVALPLDADARIRQILDEVRVLPVDVRLSCYSANFTFPRRSGLSITEPGLIDVSDRPLSGGKRLAKRALDIALTSLVTVPLLPVMAVTAIAIRLDSPGPVIFKQYRDGYNHKPVEVWKFRSMYADKSDPKARNIVTKGDPRVTRVGRFIRKWSIDELPQLFNVLRGDLSLVGPRPHAVNAISSRQQAFEEIVDGYAARHRVPPGVTGWAQINGLRGEIDDPETLLRRVEHDLYYIENRSIWLDLYILAMTPLKLLDTTNAY
ncbi:exopolysaccharide biosynthesis polyprenyl glycosylphosphotransferase [Amaricoccus macauensis]|uniref:exopolysaccharide biosynthesis polyprenyl glycosylphosphotransferase n=1 Tax=Amaricoccus macauensis TaxID=57001 RepID=UPI003C7B75D5